MRERWKKVKRVLLVKNEDLSPAQRKGFLAFNLVLSALFLWMIWMRLGYPLPTAELELRRYERTHLMPPGEIVLNLKKNETIPLDGETRARTSAPVIMAASPDEVLVGAKWDGNIGFYRCSVADGPTVSLDPDVFFVSDRVYGVSIGLAALAYGVSEEAAGGEIALEPHRGETLSGPGFRLGKGVWLFAARAKNGYTLSGSVPYTLRLYRADGSLLLEKSGTVGEDDPRPAHR